MQSPDIEQLADKSWVVVDFLIPEKTLRPIKNLAIETWKRQQFKQAHIGRGSEKSLSPHIRGDSIYWLESIPDFIDSFVQKLKQDLNERLWLGLTDVELHFARYDAGAGYQEHIDQSPSSSPLHGRRVISFILYLNEDWKKTDGGELQINLDQKTVIVEPLWGRLVLFKSEIVPHSVLASHAERWSLTGWFRKF